MLDQFIFEQIPDFDITDYFADPRNVKSGSYTDLDDLRNILLEDVKIDVNAYIDAQKNIFNAAVIGGVKKMLPARSVIDSQGGSANFGVLIKNDLLDRFIIKGHSASLDLNPNRFEVDIDQISYYNMTGSYELPYTASIDQISYYSFSGSYELPYTGSINQILDYYVLTGSYDVPYTGSINYIVD